MAVMLDFIEKLTDYEQETIALTLIQLVNLLRQSRTEDETPISLGKNRTLGLYKASNKRRWYDKNLVLMSAMNIFSTLPVEDCQKIIHGFLLSMPEEYNLVENLDKN
ncbi:MAG: hypothetical protein MZV70_70110 [Desulfobacterales bacterium]|nr:hypothetical protein [Desulfobacterales bacterium]